VVAEQCQSLLVESRIIDKFMTNVPLKLDNGNG
jgi:hypothetical protein